MSDIGPLAPRQLAEIVREASRVVLEDVLADSGYLRDIVTAYVQSLDVGDQLDAIDGGCDPSILPERLSFDYRTGGPWEEDVVG